MNKTDIENKQDTNLVEIIDQKGVETAVEKILTTNMSLLQNNQIPDRIKASAGFYVSNREDLMRLDKNNKLQMLYGVLKEAIVGCEAGTDYDIVVFKGKPVVARNKNGWFKIIDMIKPAEIVRFTVNAVIKTDEFSFNPATEEVKHKLGEKSQKYEDISGAYAYIKFANGFEKTVYLHKSDLDLLKNISPSGKSECSPWNSNSIKMVKTKVTKELAKELFTLFSGRVNSILANAIENDENSIKKITKSGFIENDNTIYNNEIIQQEEVKEIAEQNEPEKVVDMNDI